MIKEVKSYYLICDNCGETYVEYYCNYCVWLEPSMAIEYAKESDWIEHEGKHYCPSCYEVDEDDNVIIKESEGQEDETTV